MVAVALGATFLWSFLLHNHNFGEGAYRIWIPMVKREIDPALYPNDYLIEQISFYYSYIWKISAFILNLVPISMAHFFFGVSFVANFLTFLSIYLLVRVIPADRTSDGANIRNDLVIGTLAVFVTLFIGGSVTGTHMLELVTSPRLVATPVLFFALYVFLKKNFAIAGLLAGLAFLINPDSALWFSLLLFSFLIFDRKQLGTRNVILFVGILLVVAAPIIIWRLTSPPPSPTNFFMSDSWLEASVLKGSDSPSKLLQQLFKAGLITAVLLVSLRHAANLFQSRVVFVFLTVAWAVLISGILLDEIMHWGPAFMLDFNRIYKFPTVFSIIYFSRYFLSGTYSRSDIGAFAWMIPVLIGLGLLYDGGAGWRWGFAGLGLIAFTVTLYQSRRAERISASLLISAVVVVAMVVSGSQYARGSGGFNLENTQLPDWQSAQSWAKRNTKIEDVFIVPPTRNSGFRVGSERSIYGEWFDGGLIHFNEKFATEWLRRMSMLGYRSGDEHGELEQRFYELGEKDFVRIAEDAQDGISRTIYLVVKKEAFLSFPKVYENDSYAVFRIE